MADLTLVLGPDWSRFSKHVPADWAAGGEIKAADQLPKLLEFEDADIDGIQDLYDILNLLRSQRNTCVIRGQLIAGTEQPCRRLVTPRTEEGVHYAATFEEVPRSWMLIDFDSVDAPEGYDFTREPALCAELMRAALPPEFHNAACVWRASGSAGFKPGIRLHLWFLLSRPLMGDECKAWTSHADVKCDRAVYGTVQPHYTADPVLDAGVVDPMIARIGMLGGDERVQVPTDLPAELVKSAKAPKVHGIIPQDDRTLDPFLRSALRKWDDANPWDSVPNLSERFECPACGSSDGCAVLPDGKLFCHGGKHAQNAPNIGHAANNGYVMTRFEAYERLEWSQVVPRLQELGFYPGAPKRLQKATSADVSEQAEAAADVMSAVVEGRELPEINLRALDKAQKELQKAALSVRRDRARAEAIVFAFARRYMPGNLTVEAVRSALVEGDGKPGRRGPLFDKQTEDAIDRALARAEAEPWKEPASALAKDQFGKPERCHANVVKLLNLPDFTDVLAWDVRARTKLVTSPPPWLAPDDAEVFPRPVLDTDYSAIAVYLSDHLEYPHGSPGQIADALALACTTNVVDPVLDYFERLPPFEGSLDDARAVAGSWLTEFGGASDDEYTRAVAMRWLIAAVARTYTPGCKHREVLTLIGPQNKGKSMLLAALCADPAWFMDDLKPDRHDAAQSLLGTLIVEIAELDKVVASDRHGDLKSFLSTNTDKYRRPYGREFETVPRRGVMAATANPRGLFRDPTGNTRFNVVELPDRSLDIAGATAARDELWSAARMLFKAGEPWWLQADEQALAVAKQAEHVELSDAEAVLRDLVDRVFTHTTPPEFTNGAQFEKVEGGKILMYVETVQLMDYVRRHGVSRGFARQVNDSMRRLGWEYKRHVGKDAKNGPRGFQRPDAGNFLDANKSE